MLCFFFFLFFFLRFLTMGDKGVTSRSLPVF